MDGYSLVDKVLKNIEMDENHEVSIEDMIEVFSFFGLNTQASKTSRIGFVCDCARIKLKRVIEEALVWNNYEEFEKFYKLVLSKKKKEDNSNI